MTGDAEAAGESEIAVEVAYPDRIAPGDGREEDLQLGIGQRTFFFLQRQGRHSSGCRLERKCLVLRRTAVFCQLAKNAGFSEPRIKTLDHLMTN